MISTRRRSIQMKKRSSRRSPKSSRAAVSKKMAVLKHVIDRDYSNINKKTVKKLFRSAKQCVKNSKCGVDAKHIITNMNIMKNIIKCFIKKDFQGIISIIRKIDFREVTEALEDVKAVEQKIQQRKDARACMVSACFKEMTEMTRAFKIYLETFDVKTMRNALLGISIIFMRVQRELNEHHRELFQHILDEITHVELDSLPSHNNTIVLVKKFVEIVSKLSPEEKNVLMEFYKKITDMISVELPELFVILKEVSDIINV